MQTMDLFIWSNWADLLCRAGLAHAFLPLKTGFVFIWEDGLTLLPRSRLEQPGTRQVRKPALSYKHILSRIHDLLSKGHCK